MRPSKMVMPTFSEEFPKEFKNEFQKHFLDGNLNNLQKDDLEDYWNINFSKYYYS